MFFIALLVLVPLAWFAAPPLGSGKRFPFLLLVLVLLAGLATPHLFFLWIPVWILVLGYVGDMD